MIGGRMSPRHRPAPPKGRNHVHGRGGSPANSHPPEGVFWPTLVTLLSKLAQQRNLIACRCSSERRWRRSSPGWPSRPGTSSRSSAHARPARPPSPDRRCAGSSGRAAIVRSTNLTRRPVSGCRVPSRSRPPSLDRRTRHGWCGNGRRPATRPPGRRAARCSSSTRSRRSRSGRRPSRGCGTPTGAWIFPCTSSFWVPRRCACSPG